MPSAYPANILLGMSGKVSGALRGWTGFLAGICRGARGLQGYKGVPWELRPGSVSHYFEDKSKAPILLSLREPYTSMPY